MKKHITQKALKKEYKTIIKVPYCKLQYLLTFSDCKYYNANECGWRFDVYDVGSGAAICTGYGPIGEVTPDPDLLKFYDSKAAEILQKYHDYETQKKYINNLLADFCGEVLNND